MTILDRFEGKYALIEVTDENNVISVIKADKTLFSPDVREGDVLLCKDGIYMPDYETTEKRRKKIIERLKRIKKTKG